MVDENKLVDFEKKAQENHPEMTEGMVAVSPKVSTLKLGIGDIALGRYSRVNSLDEADMGNETARDLLMDMFYTCYKPSTTTKDPVPENRTINAKLIDWLTKGQSWEGSHSETVGRGVVSSYTANLLTEQLLHDEEIRKAMEEQEEANKKEEEAEQKEQEAEDQMGQGNTPAAQQLQKQAKQLRQQAQAQAQQAGQAIDKKLGTMQAQGIRAKALKEAKQEAQDVKAQLAAWGLEEGQGSTLSQQDILNLFNEIRGEGKISEIAKLMGRAKGVALKHAVPQTSAVTQITDAGYTRKFLDIYPVQRLQMFDKNTHPVIRAKTVAEYAKHGLLGRIRKTESKENGTLICAVDGSGSMEGQCEVFAKALMMGIMYAGEENGQDWRAFTFGSHRELTKPITSTSSPEAKMEWAEFMFGGGTDFDTALSYAIEQANSLGEPENADILMLTDGQCSVSQRTIDELSSLKQRFGCRLFTILVEGASGYEDIRRASDHCIVIETVEDITPAAEELSQAIWDARS
jgi:uncharacterized protein with von Willebrand factor type A (vWA) domain